MIPSSAPPTRLPGTSAALRELARPGALLLFLFPPLLLLVLLGGDFPYLAVNPVFSDLSISHYPNALYLRRMLFELGALPFWSPAILSGYPFAADPLASLWYPPGWPALLLPLPFGFTLLAALHMLWGGLGAYALLRAEGRSKPAALFGALAFEALPKLFAHYAAGHLTLAYAVPWTPWLLLASRRAFSEEERGGRLNGLLQAGPVLALIFLADPRWAAYAGLLWAGYLLWGGLRSGRLERLRHFAGQMALAALLCAPLALPLLEFTRLSTRTGMATTDRGAYSLLPGMLLDLLFPTLRGYQEYTVYAGAWVLLLAVLALLWRGPRRAAGFWLGAAGVSLVFALGESLPVFPWISRLPGFELLRVPSRAVFISGLALSAAAAAGLDALLGQAPAGEKEKRRARLALMALASFALVLAAGVWLLSGEPSAKMLWGSGVLLAGAGLVLAALSGKLQAQTLWLAGVALLLLDLGVVNRSVLAGRPSEAVLGEGAQAARYLAQQPGQFRVYSPSYSLPQQTAAYYGLELADGVDPLQLQSYVDYMEKASGVPQRGYSVTLPAFHEGTVEQANAGYLPDASLLGLLNVRYLAAEFDLHAPGFALRERFGETRIYENLEALPRAWVQDAGAPAGEGARPVQVLAWGPNRIELELPDRQGGLLVLSELAYPGWQVQVDGRPAELVTVEGLLRGVAAPDGTQRVSFVFRPVTVYLGLGLALAGILALSVRLLAGARGPGAARRAQREEG